MIVKRGMLAAALALLFLISLPVHMRSQEAAPARVTVAVRVFNGSDFVPGLNLQDFELLENGVPQKLENLFQVDKSSVVRKDGPAEVLPDTTRKFYMLFQLFEYHPKLSEAIHRLFNEVLLPGDNLYIQTPMRNYTLSSISFAQKPRDVLAKEMDEIVRRDITQGGLLYKSIIKELRRFVAAIGGGNTMGGNPEDSGDFSSEFGLEFNLTQYRESLSKMEALRTIDPNKILAFASVLKSQPGQKFVFYIYQREFRPEINSMTVTQLIDANQENQNVLSQLHDLFQVYHLNVSLDPTKIANAYADSGADFNFLFMNKTPETIPGVVMREQSEDMFKLYTRVAEATGGTSDSSQNPAAAVKASAKASEMYYLLTYTPSPAVKDGSFKTISVKVKDKGYRVVSRAGYIN
jgi:VWFA-related protein